VQRKHLFGIGLVCALASSALASTPAARRLTFDVFLDERPIGYQRFALLPTREGLRVEIQAAFEVSVLRITAFEYDHNNVEEWRGGCLHSIDARTRSNGTPYRVTGSAVSEGFLVSSNSGKQRLMECVGTFSYWDKGELLRREKLLNSQTGEYVSVVVRRLVGGSLKLGERDVPVERYALVGKDIDITLAYAVDSGEWVALDSLLSTGRTLRFRRSVSELLEFTNARGAQPQRAAGPEMSR
jgi:hypothetical protein